MNAFEFGDKRLPERFWNKARTTKLGCWEWIAATVSEGYGACKFDGSMLLSHRLAYESLIGPIPDGLAIDHRCHTEDVSCPGGKGCPHRRCVNPAHLEPVTTRENLLRGKTLNAANAAKTHCPQGHPYDEGNTYLSPKGSRDCRACRREAARRYRRRNIGQRPALPTEVAAVATPCIPATFHRPGEFR